MNHNRQILLAILTYFLTICSSMYILIPILYCMFNTLKSISLKLSAMGCSYGQKKEPNINFTIFLGE